MAKRLLVFALTLLLLVGVCPFALLPLAAEDAPEGITATDLLAPVNPHASQEAKSLLAYLQTLSDTDFFVTGTFDANNNESVYNGVTEEFGIEPGLYSARYYVAYKDGVTYKGETINHMDFYRVEEANALLKKHYDKGNILLVHADVAVEEAVTAIMIEDGKADGDNNLINHLDATNPDRYMPAYAVWMKYCEDERAALKALEDMGVKAYLFRPWVEFNYRPFCGTNDDERQAMKRVWRQTKEFFCDGTLTGCLMTYAPGAATTTAAAYPGNAYVDSIAPTLYSEAGDGDLVSDQIPDYGWMVQTGKPLGFSELSCRTGMWEKIMQGGRKSWYNTLMDMMTFFPKVTWVNTWADGAYSLLNTSEGSSANGNDDGFWFLGSPYAVNLADLPDYQHTVIGAPGIVQFYTEKDFGGNTAETYFNNYVPLEEKAYTADSLQKAGISLERLASFHITEGYMVTFYSGDDLTGQTWSYAVSSGDVTGSPVTAQAHSLEVTRPEVISRDQTIYASANDDTAWKANNGSSTPWDGTKEPDQDAWLVLELDVPCTVTSWTVQSGVANGLPDSYNLVDYALQYSPDGRYWVNLDRVQDNTLAVTERMLKKNVTARYFRLLIFTANTITAGVDVNACVVSEWELHGVNESADLPLLTDDELDYLLYEAPSVDEIPPLPEGPTLMQIDGEWVYVKDHAVCTETTLVNYGGNWYYVSGGKVNFDATGLFNYGGTYYFVNKGVVDFKTETLVNYGGSWWHVKGGQVVFDTTLVNYGENWYYVGGGKVDFNAAGLFNYGGTYYYINKGAVDFKTETLVNFSGNWWHVKGGQVVFDTTLVNYGGNWYYVGGGKVDFNATGLFNYGGTYYFVNKGVVDFKTETLVNYGGSWWHVKGGKVVFDTTLVKYGNTWYYVQGGKVNFGASGKFSYYGTNYNIKNGVVIL